VGTSGMSLAILPRSTHRRGAGGRVRWADEMATPCLRCLFPEVPPPGSTATCDTAGVLAGAVAMVASHQVVQAMKLLVGDLEALDRRLLVLDCWANEWRQLEVGGAGPDPLDPEASCPCCGQGRFEHLDGRSEGRWGALCGRDAVQVLPAGAGPGRVDLAAMAIRLGEHGRVSCTAHLLRGVLERERGELGPVEITLFADGRAILRGTRDVERARSLYARYVGT